MPAVEIGQRWRYHQGGYDFVAEVLALPVKNEGFGWMSVKCIVVDSRSGSYPVGATHDFQPFPQDTILSTGGWSYLPGQESPQ